MKNENPLSVKIFTYIRYSLRIRRVEYRIAEIPIFLIPIFLTVRESSSLMSVQFWEGFLIFMFMFAFGDLVNCLADRELDKIYKPYLTEAVYGIGVRGVVWQATASALAALILSAHLSWLGRNWLILLATACGLFTAYVYSAEPIRLKKRGLWQLVFYWFGLFFGPMIFAGMLFETVPSFHVICVALFFGLLQTGIILVNTAEDLPEDQKLGVQTVTVVLGLKKSLKFAFIFILLGSTLLLASLAWPMLSIKPLRILVLVFLPLIASSVYAASCLWIILKKIIPASQEQAIEIVKSYGKRVPLWITSTAISTLITAYFYFLWR